jgi:nucleotide-binding universal stress UspA family protein
MDINVTDKSKHSWTYLREESAMWTSDVDFWMDQMTAYQGILDESIKLAESKDDKKRIDHLQNIVTYYSKEVLIDLKSKIYHHRQKLKETKVDKGSPSHALFEVQAELRNATNAIEKALKDYAIEFRALKESLKEANQNKLRKLKTILIPTDFSENAQHASDYALTVLGPGVEKIILFTVFHNPFKSGAEPSIIDSEVRGAEKERFEEEQTRLSKAFPEFRNKIEFKYEVGNLVDQLQMALKTSKVDLVVMGTKGASGIGKLLFGSNTARVVKSVNCPVLIVPEKAPLDLPLRTMMALDMELEEKPEHFDVFTSIIDYYESRLDILHIDAPDDRVSSVHDRVSEEVLLSTLGLEQGNVRHIIAKDVKAAISEESAGRATNLLCVINHHHGWLYNALGMSITNQMVLDTTIPLLVFHK